ncbi:MAG: hypothetical protein QG657_2516 [Acidobacteriota bacterium]|nr:hypothetical protein [Acidobacteriota bacterium]
MKTKKATKKLVINKETISNLNKGEMGEAKGGTEYTQDPCDTFITCKRFCCETFLCMTDPYTNYCYSVQFCTE